MTDEALLCHTNLTYLELMRISGITNNSLKKLTQLDSLILRTCSSSLVTDDGLSHLVNLKSLNLSHSRLSFSDRAFKCLTNLEALNITKSIVMSDECLLSMPQLKSLNTFRNQITESSISRLTNLTTLSFFSNNFSLECLARLPKLRKVRRYV